MMKKIGMLCVALFLILQIKALWAQEIKELSQKVQNLVPYLKERTVAIKISVGNRAGYGSGAIISADGLILTCAHVAEISNNLSVIMPDGKEYKADKLGMNKVNDYALIRIDANNLPFFPLGSSKDLKMLEWVVALGHPGGPYPDNQPAVAIGKVRGLHKRLPIQLGEKFYDDAVQTDVPIFAGNSGGPLTDLQGRLVGINGAIMLVNDLAFAVPIDEIKADLEKMTKGENVAGRSIGNLFEIFKILMEMQEDVPPEDMQKMFKDTPLGKILKLFGGEMTNIPQKPKLGITLNEKNIIDYVEVNSLAEVVELKKGDQILSFDGQKVEDPSQIKSLLENKEIGGKITLTIQRENAQIKVPIVLDKKFYSRDSYFKRELVYQGLDLMDVTVKIKSGNKTVGYGVIIGPEGWVLSNYQMLLNRKNLVVQMQNRKKEIYPLQLVGFHGILDVAVLKFTPKEQLKAIPMGDDKNLKIGQWVISGGDETGIIQAGMVSALQREVPPNRKVPTMGIFGILGTPNKSPVRAYDKVIHHDSTIESDQFGTPLVNESGELVGINVGNFYRGTTFAVPVSSIQEVLSELKSGKSTPPTLKYRVYKPEVDPILKLFKYFLEDENNSENPENLGEILKDLFKDKKKDNQGFLGVKVLDNPQGVEVVDVEKNHAADRAGIKIGDIITEIDKQKVQSVVMLIESLKNTPPNTKILLTILRKEGEKFQEKLILVTLDRHP